MNNNVQLNEQIAQQERVMVRSDFYINDLNSLSESICSEDILKIHYGITGIRKIISTFEVLVRKQQQSVKDIQAIIDKNITPRIIQLIKENVHPLIVKEAACNNIQIMNKIIGTISNSLSGSKEQSEYVINLGALDILLELLYYKDQKIQEQAIWGLANIIPDGPQYTEFILKHIEQIHLIYQNANLEGQQVCMWAISNIQKFLPRDSIKQAQILLPIICDFIKKKPNDYDLQYDSYASLYEICQMIDNDGIEEIFNLEIIPVLINNLNYQSEDRIINIIILILQTLLKYDNKIIEFISVDIPIWLGHHNLEIRQSTLNLLMKFNNQKQINQEDVNIIQKICLIIQQDDQNTKKQAIKVMINYFKNSQFSVILALTKSMIISLIIPFLNDQIITDMLEIFDLLEQFLQLGEFHKLLLQEYQIDKNPCLLELQKQGGLEILEQLQLHQNHQVYQRVYNILTKFIDNEEI